MKYLAFSLLLAILAATGCAQTADRADPSGATEPADADYHVLMAEIALQRHQFATAASEYYQALSGNDEMVAAGRCELPRFQYLVAPQLITLNLASGGFRQFSDERDPASVLLGTALIYDNLFDQ